MSSKSAVALENWQKLLNEFKQSLAKRLWAMPTVSESEKQLVFKEYLADLDAFERMLASFHEESSSKERLAFEENELLRSLLGVPEQELKTQVFGLSNDLRATREKAIDLEQQLEALNNRLQDVDNENAVLRKAVKEIETAAQQQLAANLMLRDNDIRFYSDANQKLKDHLADLESRIRNVRTLYSDSTGKIAEEKQQEIALLQRKILEEMEQTVKEKQQLMWAEEEMFTKGVAQRVRTALVSAQGQLLLTLERLGLLDPESKTESFWRARLKILVEGADELADNFKGVQAQLQSVTEALDDYLHLTNRRAMIHEGVSLGDVIKKNIALLYVDRQPDLALEFVADDTVPDVRGDPEMLQFAVKCLIDNAVESLPKRAGRVVIGLKNQPEKKRVELVVRDSGEGIAAHLSGRVFQPFFTTKKNRQGLSLCRSKRFVELHGGTLELMNTTPQGTMFRMFLPIETRT